MSTPTDKPIRVLHLFSNCKWTGPAEPALNLCLALRDQGVTADLACAPDAGKSVNKIVETARERKLEPILEFNLLKHRRPLKNLMDRRALRRFLAQHPYDVLHCHLDNDHRIALQPATALNIPIVRSNYYGDGLPVDRDHQKMLDQTALLIEPSQRALEADAGNFAFDRANMHVVPGAVDTERFNPERATPDGRKQLNIPEDAFVIGIVARMQTHRHYEDLWNAFAAVLKTHRNTHLVVIGRGTNQEKVGMQPVRDLGLEDHVHFTGFIDGEDFVGMLRAFDVGIYLVPGSDGTCRAVREIMAMGKPMITADRGMLAEIVTHGRDGIVFDGSPDALRDLLIGFADDPAQRQQMSQAAREKAVKTYSLQAQGAAVLALYNRLLKK